MMNKSGDYRKNLENQCDYIVRIFSGETDNGLCEKRFNTICKRLAADFLPPVDREDIALLSFVLLNISNCASVYAQKNASLQKDELFAQLGFLKDIVNEFFGKRKTCGESIRRLIEKNFACENIIMQSKSVDREYALALNRSTGEFLKHSLSAYFKNL